MSNAATVSVRNQATAAIVNVTGTTVICSGQTTTLTANNTGGVTVPVYKWYSSQLAAVPFHTGNSYTTSALTSDSTFYVSVEGSNYCENASSDRKEVTVTVAANFMAGTISGDRTICYMTVPEQFVSTVNASGGHGAIVYRWQHSTDGGTTWNDINGANASEYSPGALTQTTQYRRLATNNCGTVQSNAVTVTVSTACLVADYAVASCEIMPLVIDVLANDIIDPACTSPVINIVEQPENGNANVNNGKIEYDGVRSGLDSLTYSITCGAFVSNTVKVYITVNDIASAFVDDLWYYGENSQGIRFANNGAVYSATDASGESKVASRENSLVVSSPYCDGQNIFYSSHNRLYNSHHEPMLNGHFMGHHSIADGLAACYMGNNKYLFFSVTDAYEAGNRGLKAYTVDMNVDHGRGAIVDSFLIENSSADMSESVELITSDRQHIYWLVYAYKNGIHHELRVRQVDVSNPGNPVGAVIPALQTSTQDQHTYTLKASPQNNRIAIANADDKTVDVFDFDNSTGTISNRRTSPNTHLIDGVAYGVEFSPDGNMIYAAGYTKYNGGHPLLCQYEISTSSLIHRSSIQYWTYTGVDNSRGGGLKLGPDSMIYVMLAYDSNIGTVSNPNSAAPLSGRYNAAGMTLGVNVDKYALQFSTGLTRPSIMECNANTPPVPQPDEAELCISPVSRTVKVNVLENDSDIDNDRVFLTDAAFVNPSDSILAGIAVNAADSTVSLTVKPDAYIEVSGHVFRINYSVKDDGTPASQCATGSLEITVYPAPSYPDIRVSICPDAGTVNLSKYLDTVNFVEQNSIQWASQILGVQVASPAGTVSVADLSSSRIHTFTYTVSSRCVSEQKRKLYLEVLQNGMVRRLKDTVAICYRYADAIHIDQLFGIEAQGTFSYPSDVDQYVNLSSGGATIMNGREIYENNAVADYNYHGIADTKKIEVVYTPDIGSCLGGQSYKVVIILTRDIAG
jgi:hypothetical protein